MFVIVYITAQNVPPAPPSQPCPAGYEWNPATGTYTCGNTTIKEKGPINQGLGRVQGVLSWLAQAQAAKKLTAKKLKATFPTPSTPSTGEGVD